MRLSSSILVAVAALLVAATTSSAGPPGTWSVAGSGMRSVSGQIGVARTADGVLHILWSRGGGGSAFDLLETRVSAAGAVTAPRAVVSGWANVGDPAAVGDGRSVSVVFPGVKTLATGDPTDGLSLATSSGGSWAVGATAIYARDFVDTRIPALAAASGTLLQAWEANGEVVVHAGTDPAVAARRGFGSGTNVGLASDGRAAWVAWCSGPTAGVSVRGVAPATGAPVGAARRMPGGASRCPATTRTPIVARAGGGAFVAGGTPDERAVRVWRVGGGAASVSVGSGIKQQIALAAAPDGRLWVGWRDTDSGGLVLRRSNRTGTVWGAPVRAPRPAGQDAGIYNLDLAAQADRVDVVARTAKDTATVSLHHTQVFPGLSTSARAERGVVTVRVTDAGDPVAGASVTVGGRRARTGADGTAEITVEPGRYPVVATKPRYVSARSAVQVKR